MKICYIHHSSAIGGGSLALLRVIEALDRRRFYPKVIFPNKGDVINLFESKGIKVIINPQIRTFSHTTVWYSIENIDSMIMNFFRIFTSAFATYRIIKKERPDIVHLNTSGLLGSALGARLANVPVVWHVREPLNDGYFGIRKKLIAHYIHFFSDIIISICKSDAKRLIASKKLRIIYDFVDFKEFNRNIRGDAFRKEFKIGPKDKSVGMFGGITSVKGTMIFVKAAEIVYDKNRNVKFFIFGPKDIKKSGKSLKAKYKAIKKLIFRKEDYISKVMSYVSNSNAKNNIYFCGNRTDIPEMMAGLDFIVFPSTVPHSALPLMEAGAMAKPVVASNLGGQDELVVDGITGILVPPNDPEALAVAIIQILEDEGLVKRFGENGYRRAKELFNADKNGLETVRIYDEVLDI